MKKRDQIIFRLFVGVFIIGWVVYLAPMFAIFSDAPSCEENSEAVAYARSLTQERLKKLYYDMEGYSTREDIPYDGYNLFDETQSIPSEFSDLKVRKIRPADENIMVEGCLDHFVFLRFEGFSNFRKNDSNRQIILTWGERPPDAGSQVLWAEKR